MPTTRPTATWNRATGVWETESAGLCGHSELFSESWPISGTTRAGRAYARPMWAHLTDASASSSPPGLLPTPDAYAGARGGSQPPEKRQAGGHSVSLQDVAEHMLPTPTARDHKGHNQRRDDTCLTGALLPTPRATDGTKGGPNQRGSSGDLMLPSAVHLLPTPTAQAAKHAADDRGPGTLDDCNLWSVAARLGANTPPPSSGGNESPGDLPPLLLS